MIGSTVRNIIGNGGYIVNNTGEGVLITKSSNYNVSPEVIKQAFDHISKNYPLAQIQEVPTINSSKISLVTQEGRMIEIYFDIHGKVVYNFPKLIVVDMTQAAAGGMINPISIVNLESAPMLKIDDSSMIAIDDYLAGSRTNFLDIHVGPDQRMFELSKIIDFSTIEKSYITGELVDFLEKIVSSKDIFETKAAKS